MASPRRERFDIVENGGRTGLGSPVAGDLETLDHRTHRLTFAVFDDSRALYSGGGLVAEITA